MEILIGLLILAATILLFIIVHARIVHGRVGMLYRITAQFHTWADARKAYELEYVRVREIHFAWAAEQTPKAQVKLTPANYDAEYVEAMNKLDSIAEGEA
jgi:hypothetical protein